MASHPDMQRHQTALHQLLTQHREDLACPTCGELGSMSPNWDNPYVRLVCYRTVNGVRCPAKLGERPALHLLEALPRVEREPLLFVQRGLATARRPTAHAPSPAPTDCDVPTQEAPRPDPLALGTLRAQVDLLISGMADIKAAQCALPREQAALATTLSTVVTQLADLVRQVSELRQLIVPVNGAPTASGDETPRPVAPAPSATAASVAPVPQASMAPTRARRSAGPPVHVAPTFAMAVTNGVTGVTARSPMATTAPPPSTPSPEANRSSREQAALASLLVTHQRAPIKFAFIYAAGIRRQPIKAVVSSLRAVGIKSKPLQLTFLEDSNTLALMLPERDVQATLAVLKDKGVDVRTDLPPEQVAAIDSSKLARMPEDKRATLAAKRTAQHLRRLALQCPLKSLQKFMCSEITRMGQQAPTRREREAADRQRREKQAKHKAAAPPGTADEDGWITPKRRKHKKAKPSKTQAQRRQEAAVPRSEQARQEALAPRRSPENAQQEARPRAVAAGEQQLAEDGPDLDPTLFAHDDEEEWLRSIRDAASGSGWVSGDEEVADDAPAQDLDQNLVSDTDMDAEIQDTAAEPGAEDVHMTSAALAREDDNRDEGPLPAAKKTRTRANSPRTRRLR